MGLLVWHRVYLIGGAAAEGTPGDAVVVYTPSVLREGIYMANLTLPHGTLWSDVIEPPGQQPASTGEHLGAHLATSGTTGLVLKLAKDSDLRDGRQLAIVGLMLHLRNMLHGQGVHPAACQQLQA